MLHILGIRPKGKGLLQWNLHYILSGKGVMGYDPIQGAFSPHLRLQIHLSCLLLTWSAVIFVLLSPFPSEILQSNCSTFRMPQAVWTMGFITVAAYSAFFYYNTHCKPGVSDPGGPRSSPIQRTPTWPDKSWDLPENSSQWRFVTAQEAHDVSATDFAGTKARLTGEPAGRDIWTNSPASSQQPQKVDEALVQQLASGGRPCSFNPSINPNSADLPFRQQMIRDYLLRGNEPPPQHKFNTLRECLQKAVHFYSMLQTPDGHWSGDYGGPHFLLPGLIVVWYCMGRPQQMFSSTSIDLMIHYIRAHQQSDGGWGTHLESPSTMFGTTLMYVALRCLGTPQTESICVRARLFLEAQGGCVNTSSWAKFYLCLLGAMEWEGHNVVPAELWLLPNWCPFHPGRMWCHARMVYRELRVYCCCLYCVVVVVATQGVFPPSSHKIECHFLF